jgi:hypothetical protein
MWTRSIRQKGRKEGKKGKEKKEREKEEEKKEGKEMRQHSKKKLFGCSCFETFFFR